MLAPAPACAKKSGTRRGLQWPGLYLLLNERTQCTGIQGGTRLRQKQQSTAGIAKSRQWLCSERPAQTWEGKVGPSLLKTFTTIIHCQDHKALPAVHRPPKS
eukprot:scaffold121888_cov19-Tisochrysis_lutea.AAC.3